MAYRKKASSRRRAPARSYSSNRRSTPRRGSVRKRSSSARRSSSGVQTIRIVMEQPKPAMDPAAMRDLGMPSSPSVPRRSRF